jgi:hypothetical protein
MNKGFVALLQKCGFAALFPYMFCGTFTKVLKN